jgi:hypothetical protein
MFSNYRRAIRMLVVAACPMMLSACLVSTATRRNAIDAREIAGTHVTAPMTAHLRDGSVVVFDSGATIGATRVTGPGRSFDVARQPGKATDGVPLDSVMGFEVYERKTNRLRTLVYVPVTLVGVVAATGLVFGCCKPTFGSMVAR